MAFNVDYDTVNVKIVQNDTWSQTFTVKRNNVAYDMSGAQLDIEVKDEDDVSVLAISSAGTSPAITISGSSFTILQNEAFDTVGKYYYDVQLTEGTKVSTVCRGAITVIKEYTD